MHIKQRIFLYTLLLGSGGWIVSFFFTFTSWPISENILHGMGAERIAYQPLLDYWLKMASSTFGCIGIMYFICFLNPKKYFYTINLLSYMSIFVGIVITCSAIKNHLTYPTQPTFIIDIVFCFYVGAVSLYFNFSINKVSEI
jgi:hypothetical protein